MNLAQIIGVLTLVVIAGSMLYFVKLMKDSEKDDQ